MNYLRYTLFCLFFSAIICLLPISLYAKATPEDSLRTLLHHTQDPQKRMKVLINLDDYCHYVSQKGYPETTYVLLNEAIKARNEYAITRALRGLVMAVDRRVRSFTNDSVVRYLKIAEENLTGEYKKSFITEVHLRQIRHAIDWTEDEEKTTSYIMERYTALGKGAEDLYNQIECEYAMGKITSFMMSGWQHNAQKAQHYFDHLLALLEQLPVEYRAHLMFSVMDNFFVTYFNADEKAKAVKMLHSMMSTLEQYNNLSHVKGEIYQDYDYELSLFYDGMARCPEIIGKEKAYAYLLKLRSLPKEDEESMMTLYNTYKTYYKSLGDDRQVILYGDSIMSVMDRLGYTETKAVFSALCKEQAQCYANLGDYKNAYQRFRQYDILQDSIVSEESKNLRQEMGVRYNVNQLELEAAQLESRNRSIGLISTGVFLLLSMAWGIHQRVNYKKIQRVQKKLIVSNQEVIRQSEKAQESERMKTAFVNSMCHEIRTPLNSINGFSSLLLDQSIDSELKAEFPELIQQNTDQLTRLINDLLEVSSLDSSDEALPMEEIDVYTLCEQELDKLKTIGMKTSIDYRLEMKEGDGVIHTHQMYLARVIGNLLNNANKFTDRGSVVLNGYRDVEKQELVMSITDTGMGIPVDKQEWVFERFTKIDEFKSGTGLGLYVCRLILNRLNGTIRIDPEYRGGSRFILTLPA